MKKDQPKWKKRVEKVMKEFNFDFVHKTMTLLDWWWVTNSNGYGSTEYGVPSKEDIKAMAKDLLTQVIDSRPGSSLGSDGLVAHRFKGGLGLDFVVISADSHP